MSGNEYQFTKDWFHWAPEVWSQLIPLLPVRTEQKRHFIEIGAFEGRSTVWIAENMMAAQDHLTCIDTWEGGEENSAEDMAAVEARFDHNLAVLEHRHQRIVSKVKGSSTPALAQAIINHGIANADFIYVDGSHTAPDVLTDACMAWAMVKPKGLMVFDDYLWGNPRDALHRPKIAIDAFTNIFGETAAIIHVGRQLVVRKNGS